MRRSDFLRLAVLAPLAKLFGWRLPEEPTPEVSAPFVFQELGKPQEYTVTYSYSTPDDDWVYLPYSDSEWGQGEHTVTQWVVKTTESGRGRWRTMTQSVRRL